MTKKAKALIIVTSVTILLLVLMGLPVNIPMGGSAISLVPDAQAIPPVPEPSTLAVLGLVGLYFIRRRRNNRSKND
jgi:PEP-CTERM motif